ncbi:MAG: starch-binding protein, partial [Muribaculaceae bacterium]|nr:starch-binding protein [Muribaculaceae bacterium]
MTVATQEDGSKVWSCEFSPNSTTFQWKWYVKIAGEENARWYGRGIEYFANGEWVQMSTVDKGGDKGINYVNGLDPNKTYRISIKALSAEIPDQPIGCIEDVTATKLPSAIPDGLTREDGIFTVFFDLTGMDDHGTPKIWIWSDGGAGNDYFDGGDAYPGMQMTHVSGNIYKWEYRGDKADPTKVIFTYGDTENFGKYYGGEGVDVKNGDFFTKDGVQGTVPAVAPTPAGWYVMGDAFGSVASAANKMSAYEGANDIYYIDITSATAGQKVWFKSFEHDCVITPESSRDLKLGMKWLGATDEKNVGYFAFAEDCAEGRLFVNTMSNQVILADKSFNPLTGNGTEIVFFLGDKEGAVKEVNFLLGKDDNYTLFEGARWEKAPYKGFWFIEIPDVGQYDDIKFSVRIDGDNYGNFYDVVPSRVDAYDRANWWKYIYGQIEPIEGVGATSFQTYITPDEYLYEAAKTKTTVYVFGNGFTSNSQTPNWYPEDKANTIVMNLYNGIGVLEMDGVTNSGDNRTKLKLSWMPYFDYIDATDGDPVRKRAWASFNLGIVGGFDAVATGGENSSSMFYLRKPRKYNNYSESDWVLADGDENNVTGTCYLVLDSKESTLTLLTFNPKVGLSNNYSIKVEQRAIGGLDESLFTDGKMFKGSEAGGNAYPELANDLEVTFTVTPAYLNSDIEGLADKIKALYNVKYLFYNC